MRTVEWDYKEGCLKLIDQRILPAEFQVNSYYDYHQLADAIRDMVVRGAPAIGAAAGFGMALAAFQSRAKSYDELIYDIGLAMDILIQSRITAVNLRWAVNRVHQICNRRDLSIDQLKELILVTAQRIADEDVETNLKMSNYGAVLIDDGDVIIHHCNTGALAAVDWGTALGVIRMAHQNGKKVHVLVDETRPRLQGARLTAWELQQYGIPYEIITDSAAGYFLSTGEVNKVFFGADRVTASGDVANKIGTYMLCLAALDNRIPAYAVIPSSTIDFSIVSSEAIPIEERNPDEVLNINYDGKRVAPQGSSARNPAFDITPHRLISAIVTEYGVIYPPFSDNLALKIPVELNLN